MTTTGRSRGEQLVTPHRPAEALFGLGPIEVAGDTARGHMRTAGWMTDAAGRPSAGMLGVLLDDVVGQATLNARPEGCWPVTAELSIDVLAGLPVDGTVLTATSELLVGGERTGSARGEVRDPAGRLLALAVVTAHYTDGAPDLSRTPPPAPSPRTGAVLHEALQATLGVGADARVLVTLPPGPTAENAAGMGHGGVLAALADVAAAATFAREDQPPLRTTALRVTYLRPAVLDDVVTFEARAVRRGRSTGLARVDIVGGDGRLCAVASVTAGA
ncbi:MAG TPA: PaaI family thioesterase [Actinomycetospora sp.]|uniref:PaaI family thioesterase n=1 Tax=Actinomycetospora sp. TaxID=1872135 RepID=UPI002F41AC58